MWRFAFVDENRINIYIYSISVGPHIPLAHTTPSDFVNTPYPWFFPPLPLPPLPSIWVEANHQMSCLVNGFGLHNKRYLKGIFKLTLGSAHILSFICQKLQTSPRPPILTPPFTPLTHFHTQHLPPPSTPLKVRLQWWQKHFCFLICSIFLWLVWKNGLKEHQKYPVFKNWSTCFHGNHPKWPPEAKFQIPKAFFLSGVIQFCFLHMFLWTLAYKVTDRKISFSY